MKKIQKALVTGGAGFVGSHIVDELLKRDIQTIVIDNLSSGSLANLDQHKENKLLEIIVDDARNVSNLLYDESGIDVVFHEAAIISVPRSVKEPSLVHDVNVNVSLDLMNFCVEKNVNRFIFASTAAVYGVIGKQKASEEMNCKPFSPYGASKLAVENYLNAYHHSYNFEPVILRYFNIFGTRQKQNDYSGVITTFINKLLSGNPPTIHGDGLQIRDFVSVHDIVQANMLSMESNSAIGKTFNVASGNSITILELLEILKEIINAKHIKHEFGTSRLGDVRYGMASIKNISDTLGFKAITDKKSALSEVIQFIKTANHRRSDDIPIVK